MTCPEPSSSRMAQLHQSSYVTASAESDPKALLGADYGNYCSGRAVDKSDLYSLGVSSILEYDRISLLCRPVAILCPERRPT